LSNGDYIQPINEIINRLGHLTSLDRSEGWQESTAEFLIGHFEAVLGELRQRQPVSKWMNGSSILMTLDNPGILSGTLRE
jgi:hypothetical protein